MYPHPDTVAGTVEPGVDVIAVDFPRPQKGANTQHLMVTMLGEFWRTTERWLPVQVILELAAGLGVTRSAATTALSRLAARGVLENDGAGRLSQYRFTASARTRLQVGFEQIAAFGDPSRPWDKRWTAIAFSIPETSRDIRDTFRARLRWLGFAPLYGALWVSPRDRLEEAHQVCSAFGIEDFLVFRLADADLRGKDMATAWPLQDTACRYDPFIEKYSAVIRSLRRGSIAPSEAFRLRVEVMDEWRAFPWEDPGLPYELLPAEWPLAAARRTFLEVHAGTAEPTRRHLGGILTAAAPDLPTGMHLDLIGI